LNLAQLPSIDQVEVAGHNVLVRADLNLPIKNGTLSDASRLKRLIPTIRDLVERRARVILMSHFGRPNGLDKKLSLAPIAAEIERELQSPVTFVPNCIGLTASSAVERLRNGSVALLENLRFHPQEERNDPDFAQLLADHADFYVNDAFSCSHRAHASVDAITRKLPSFAGPLLLEEIAALTSALERPERPVMAVIGGSKVSSKLEVLLNLVEKVNRLAIGGGMANTFLAAQGYNVGRSLVEPEMFDTVRAIEQKAQQNGCKILLPHDVVTAPALFPNAQGKVFFADDVPDNQMIFDIGTVSIAALCAEIVECRTLIWNGPLGVFEHPRSATERSASRDLPPSKRRACS
jgi:phosphoglycerate kinase